MGPEEAISCVDAKNFFIFVPHNVFRGWFRRFAVIRQFRA